MTLSENLRMVLKEAEVSEEAYLSACQRIAQQPETYGPESHGTIIEDIPHDIGGVMEDVQLAWEDGLELWLEIYADLPCYGLLMYLRWWEKKAPKDIQLKIWAKYRDYLSLTDDRLAAPIVYTMWCDYFEDPKTVEEAWSRLVTDDAPARLLQRVLEASGPVPYSLKAPLYERLVDDPSWHLHILQSLVSSQFDYFGQIDSDAARDMLMRLQLPEDAPNLADIRAALGVT